jgi:hypothetical protein
MTHLEREKEAGYELQAGNDVANTGKIVALSIHSETLTRDTG